MAPLSQIPASPIPEADNRSGSGFELAIPRPELVRYQRQSAVALLGYFFHLLSPKYPFRFLLGGNGFRVPSHRR
jgi:hypothetical protein